MSQMKSQRGVSQKHNKLRSYMLISYYYVYSILTTAGTGGGVEIMVSVYTVQYCTPPAEQTAVRTVCAFAAVQQQQQQHELQYCNWPAAAAADTVLQQKRQSQESHLMRESNLNTTQAGSH